MAEENKSDHGGGGHGPIIVKKGKKHDHPFHGGAWKVAYADFVTAMMALFIVLWILSSEDIIKEEVADYFRDPIGYYSGKGISVIDGQMRNMINQEALDDLITRGEERQMFSEMGEELLEELQRNPDLSTVMDNVVIEFIDEGMLIELVESSNNVFFEIGTSTLNPEALKLLKIIGEELSKIPNAIIIEGHTDARPYPNDGTGFTNYELSANRANAARRALVMGGLNKNQVYQVRGLADNKLRNPNDPYDVVNRRISIIVKYTDM